jgi:hypothetical protein
MLITSLAMKVRSRLRSVCGVMIPFSRMTLNAALAVGNEVLNASWIARTVTTG